MMSTGLSKMNYLLLSTIISLSLSQDASDWEDEFDYNTYLDSNQQFKLYWTLHSNNTIELGMEANATGWIALGLSPNGQMPHSDIMFGWVADNGVIYLQDRYTVGRSVPLYDDQQNLTLIYASESDGYTRIRFSRPQISCDPQDLSFEKGTSRMLYAFNKDTDPTEEFFDATSVEWHGNNKGTQSLNIDTGIPDPVKLENDTEYFDATNDNAHVPANETTYWCKLIKLPVFNDTHHIVKVAPVISEGSEPIIHHMLTYACPKHLAESPDNYYLDGPCDNWEWSQPATRCQAGGINYAWAVGGNALYYPEEAGMPISGDSDLQYVVLQIHYNNPEKKAGYIDSSGIRVWHTPTLRQYDAGLISIGTSVNPYGQFIPPGIDWTRNSGFCTSDCTQTGITGDDVEDGTVYAFASLLHAHTIAVALNLRQIRDGQELANIDQNWAYDFNYQQTIIFDELKEIKAGDSFIMDCFINSTGRDWITVGGESTTQEMCLAFIYVYPAPDLAICWTDFSDPSFDAWLYDAQDAGYLDGNISMAIGQDWDWKQLSWDNQGDEQAAEDFYNELWNPHNDRYNTFYQRCTSENGTWLVPKTIDGISRHIPQNFTPYHDNSYNCNETNVNPPNTATVTIDRALLIGIIAGAVIIACVVITVILKCICARKRGWAQGQELGNYGKLQNV